MKQKVRMIMARTEDKTKLTDEQIKATITKFCEDLQEMISTKFKSINLDMSKDLKEISDSVSKLKNIGGK